MRDRKGQTWEVVATGRTLHIVSSHSYPHELPDRADDWTLHEALVVVANQPLLGDEGHVIDVAETVTAWEDDPRMKRLDL